MEAAGPLPEFLVKYRDGAEPGVTALAGADYGNGLAKLGVTRVKPASGQSAAALLSELQNDPSVEFAEPNYLRRAVAVTTDDPEYQWNLNAVHAAEAWAFARGSGDVIVAVIDSGVNLQHPELSGRLMPGYDFVNHDQDANDDLGHGTTVAGIIAANCDNHLQVAGLTWQAKVMPMKVLDSRGDGYDSDVAAAIIEAADRGAQVINLSLGGAAPSQTLQQAVDYAYARGATIVAAAGNAHAPVYYPAACEHVIAVGASTETSTIASFSNFGATLDLVAPGVGVVGISADSSVARTVSGTSFSSPQVAAAATLLLSVDQALGPDEIGQLLIDGATDLSSSGWDETSGFGLLNILASINLLQQEKGLGAIAGSLMPESAVFTLDERPIKGVQYPAGTFLISGVPSGSHELAIDAPGFLPASFQSAVEANAVANLGLLDLAYGDANGDGQVDIFDLVAISRGIGGEPDSSAHRFDSDGDGAITVLDLANAAMHYGETIK
jgi:subtilisin family serine protease